MQAHSDLIPDFLDSNGPTFLIICDAGRTDVFEEIYDDYLSGDYQRVSNGGVLNTPAWFGEHFSEEYNAMLFHGGQPIRSIGGPIQYDERQHFDHIPYTTLYEEDETLRVASPETVNGIVRRHLPDRLAVDDRLHALGYRPSTLEHDFSFYVIRYLQPHVPYRTLPQTAYGKRDYDCSEEELLEAYIDNYRWVLEAVSELVDELPGEVVVTADHGECLGDCGQRFHGYRKDAHDHLVTVPWLEVDTA